MAAGVDTESLSGLPRHPIGSDEQQADLIGINDAMSSESQSIVRR